VATVLIKKYGNRRLYDTGDSRYVTLDELATKIRSGADLRVVDAQTGDDLTQATLTQIVLETGNAAKFLPVQLLTQMIRLSDDSLAEFFSRYVTGALDVYLQAKRGVQSLAAYNPLTQIPMAATDALTRMWMGSPFGGPTGYPPPQYGGYGGAPPVPYPVPSSPAAPDDETEESAPPPRKSEPAMKRAKTEPSVEDARADDVAAMRRELDELKQAVRDSMKPRSRKKKG
jgi:polyhydroxyalkanoate synthesis repressor PhaR